MTQLADRWNAARALLRDRRDDPPLVRVRSSGLPASFAQEGLFFLDRLQPASTAYNLAVVCRLQGSLQVHALERSLGELSRRHDILRTTLAMVDGQVVQRVAGEPTVLPAAVAVADEELPAWATARANRPFSLEQGPLFRAELARTSERDHSLLLAHHHAVGDAWSFELLMRELCTLYAAHCRGEPASLPPVALQYGDFAAWQRRRLAGPLRDRLLGYWAARFAQEPPRLALPTDRPRLPGPNRRGESQTMVFPPDLAQALAALAASEGATLYTVLLAAFTALLHRYTGADDVVVGSPVAGRHRAELGEMLGMLTNTLALRTDLGGEPSFRGLLGRVGATVTTALAHQELPFELLVRAVGLHGYASSPLFRVMLAFQNVPRTRWVWPGLACAAQNLVPDRAKFDLTLTMQDKPEGLAALLEYDADLFDRSTMRALLGHMGNLLAGAAASPDRSITHLPLLGPAERSRLLAQGQGQPAPLPPAPSVHRLFEMQVRSAPEAPALIAPDGAVVSYDQLNRRANRLARRLASLGLGPGARVGVCVERSVSLLAAELAILKAGAAYVPVESWWPAPQIHEVLGQLAAVVTGPGWPPPLSRLDLPRVAVDDPGLAGEREDDLAVEVTADQVAYVMFTSGSTGARRGALIPHRGVTRLGYRPPYVRVAPDDVFLQLAPVGFDASTFETWTALLAGARLALAPPQRLSLSEIVALVARRGVTILWLSAGLFELWVDAGLPTPASVKQLLTGGDVMSVSHAQRFLRDHPDCRLLNGYGPTENTTFTTTYPVERVEHGSSIPIGWPITGTQVHVLDRHLEPVPRGVVGEGYLGGAGVALGYLGDAEATRARFVQSPFAPGHVLYRSGDRMRRRADGALELAGRADDQVKIRGFRVELGEVERQVAACPGVRQALVRAEGLGASERRLVAYVVSDPAGTASPAELRSWLRARLPAYQVPSVFVPLAELPVTANGKRDRKLRVTRAVLSPPSSRPPRGDGERRLARIFAAVLGQDAVGIDDDFFDRGGDSLGALRAAARIERELGCALPLALFFENPTVAGLARALGEGAPPIASGDGIVVVKAGRAARPLFFMPGGRGGERELAICAKLVSRLPDDETVLGLVAPAQSGQVEELAAGHLATVKRVQPRGPYRLGGECIGGLVAYELAQQLRNRGDEVELLLLLDTWCPTEAPDVAAQSRRWLRPGHLMRKSAQLLRAGVEFLAELPGRDPSREPWPVELWRRVTVPLEARRHITACLRYRPAPYPGRIVLVASDASLLGGVAVPWLRLAAGGARICRAPGDHDSYSRKHYRETAEQLRRCLAEESAGKGKHDPTRRP